MFIKERLQKYEVCVHKNKVIATLMSCPDTWPCFLDTLHDNQVFFNFPGFNI